MYDYIKGQLDRLTPAAAVVEAGGVGYYINISLQTFSSIESATEVKLYTHFIVREDAQVLYGFYTLEEREVFRALIGVSGVGGNTARMILSALSPSELINVISTENANLLKTVKGIGLKTAQRVIVDLKDKIKTCGMVSGAVDITGPAFTAANAQVQEEAVAALTMLGFAQAPSQKVVTAILKEDANAPVEQVIKLALKRL